MSWRTITTRSPGICIYCNKRIEVGKTVQWSKNQGICHPDCIPDKELVCIVCAGKTGCSTCEFRDDCDPDAMSDYCICKRCSGLPNPLESYRTATSKKFPGLGSRRL